MDEIVFKPYERIEFGRWGTSKAFDGSKIRFEMPNKLNQYQDTIINCAFFCKIAKSINHHFKEINKQFHIKYYRKALYKESTYSIKIDRNKYLITIKTGLELPKYLSEDYYVTEVLNESINLNNVAEKQLMLLLEQLKRSLPSDRYYWALERVKSIANL